MRLSKSCAQHVACKPSRHFLCGGRRRQSSTLGAAGRTARCIKRSRNTRPGCAPRPRSRSPRRIARTWDDARHLLRHGRRGEPGWRRTSCAARPARIPGRGRSTYRSGRYISGRQVTGETSAVSRPPRIRLRLLPERSGDRRARSRRRGHGCRTCEAIEPGEHADGCPSCVHSPPCGDVATSRWKTPESYGAGRAAHGRCMAVACQELATGLSSLTADNLPCYLLALLAAWPSAWKDPDDRPSGAQGPLR